MKRACPNCQRRVEATARYCPDCYTVFASDGRASQSASGGERARVGGKGWAFALILFAALGGAWFHQIDTEDWSAEPGSFQAKARDMKRQLAGYVASLSGGAETEAERREGPLVERADVRQSARGCAVSRTVVNRGTEAVSPVILTFSFKAEDGSRIDRAVSAPVNEPLPAGASRVFTFELPCPEMFASVRARSTHPGIEIFASGRSRPAEARVAWFLGNDRRLACAFGASCEVVIRFPSGDLANYLLERRRNGGSRFYALDQRGIDLLSASTSADLVARAPGGGTWSVPIDREADDRWTIVEEPRLSAAAEPRSKNGG